MNNTLKAIVSAIMLLSSATALCEKKAITLPYGYSVGEVTADNVIIRSGPGSQYPIASYKYMDAYVRNRNLPAGTIKAAPAYKGDLMWVKEEGDWYKIDPKLIGTEEETTQYISKEFIRLVESEPFEIGKITEPHVYINIFKESDEEGNEEFISFDELIIYPDGFVVDYSVGLHNNAVMIGSYKDGDPAIRWRRAYDVGHIDNVPKGTRPSVGINDTGSQILLTFNQEDNRNVSARELSANVPDLSQISFNEWVTIFIKSHDMEASRATKLSTSDFPFLTKDELDNNYVRIK